MKKDTLTAKVGRKSDFRGWVKDKPGAIAQLARASALQAECQGFESL